MLVCTCKLCTLQGTLERRKRVHIGAYVDAEVRDDLLELARERDRSVSSILRRAMRAELNRLRVDDANSEEAA